MAWRAERRSAGSPLVRLLLRGGATSASVFCGSFGEITTSSGASPPRAIGVKSASGSYGALFITSFDIVCVFEENSSV